jgi:hypothetical protein
MVTLNLGPVGKFTQGLYADLDSLFDTRFAVLEEMMLCTQLTFYHFVSLKKSYFIFAFILTKFIFIYIWI